MQDFGALEVVVDRVQEGLVPGELGDLALRDRVEIGFEDEVGLADIAEALERATGEMGFPRTGEMGFPPLAGTIGCPGD